MINIKRFIQKIRDYFVGYNVFISFEDKDIKYATIIRDFLIKFGAKVFVYKRSIEVGKKWREEIKDNLKYCDLFIVLISSRSLKSANVRSEMGGAYFLDKDYLPVLLEDVKKDYLGMIDELQYVNYKDKKFFPSLRNRMFKIYLKRAFFLIIIIGIYIYSKFN